MGVRAVLMGLQSRAELNGRLGTVASYAKDKERYTVELQPEEGSGAGGVVDRACVKCGKEWSGVPRHVCDCPAPCGGRLLAVRAEDAESLALKPQNLEEVSGDGNWEEENVDVD